MILLTQISLTQISLTQTSLTQASDDPDQGGQEGDAFGEEEDNVLLKTRPKTKKPDLYKVMLLNDDYTPMEFVIHILERFFRKNKQEATDSMMHVHRRGVDLGGRRIIKKTETKVAQVMDFARASEQPLQCIMEKE